MSFLAIEPTNFRRMIEQSVALLRAKLEQAAKRSGKEIPTLEVELGDPLRDTELDDVQAKIGLTLDPRFVALFRAVNGFRVACGTRRAHVRPLRELMGNAPNAVLSALGDTKLLGGISASELQTRSQPLGGVTDLRADYFHVIALFANPANPDPVALLVDDYGAVAGDHRPVRGRDLLWLLALQLDLAEIVGDGWFEAHGFDGAHPIVELDLACWELPSALDETVRGDYFSDVLCHLKGVVGLKGWSEIPPPVRWHEERHAVHGAAESIARAAQASSPGREWDIDQNRGILEVATALDVRISFATAKRAPKKDPNGPSRSQDEDFDNKVATELTVVWSSAAPPGDVQRLREAVAAAAAAYPASIVESNAKLAANAKAKPASKARAKSAPKAKARPQAGGSKPALNTKAKPETKMKRLSKARSASKSKAGSASKSKAKSASKSKTKSASKSKAKSASKSKRRDF
jgi:hypothetical protein